MSDRSYRLARLCCYPAFCVSSRPVILHRQRAAMAGGYILAPNHLSYFDAPVLVGHTPRQIDFLTSIEAGQNRWARAFLSLFDVFYLDRRRPNSCAMRSVLRRLRQGRVVGWFPEGGVRTLNNSVVNGGSFQPGIAQIAAIAAVPVIPCVVLGAAQYLQVRSWLPFRRTRYGVIFGLPLRVHSGADASEARAQFLNELQHAYLDLNRELAQEMKRL
jgi:1-acyl-sn-glycerol-3-phosphate acyltransferase